MQKRKRKIIVSVTNDLVTDHRVHKVCLSLYRADFEILLVGRIFRKSQAINRPYGTHRMRLLFNRSFLFYAEYNIRLFLFLLFSRADIFLSNDTDSVVANYLASRIRNKPLVFDAHEMFPEVPELVDRNFVKKVWTKIEDWIFPKLTYSYTVCQPIADIYNKKYGINMQVVRNIPFATSNAPVPGKQVLEAGGKHVLLYQGAINVGRGIEWIIDAMLYLDDFIFFIAGDGDVMQEMQAYSKKRGTEDRVKFLGRIPLDELPAYTACAELGMSLLENRGLNYFYSLPNRIFDFIRADVPVLATDFPEIRRIISTYEIGTLIDNYEPHYLASIIKEMVIQKKNTEGFRKANAELTWENESEILLKIISRI